MPPNDVRPVRPVPAEQVYEACSAMHTALRKCCDSAPTSALYNIIQMVEIEPPEMNAWIGLGKLVAEGLKAGLSGLDALKAAHDKLIRRMSDAFHSDPEFVTPPKNAREVMYAIHCTMRTFDEIDWAGMADYLGDGQ